jgi:hypothetical protein
VSASDLSFGVADDDLVSESVTRFLGGFSVLYELKKTIPPVSPPFL